MLGWQIDVCPQVRWATTRLWMELKDLRLDELTAGVSADKMRAEGRVKQEEMKWPQHKTEKEQPPGKLGNQGMWWPRSREVKYWTL